MCGMYMISIDASHTLQTFNFFDHSTAVTFTMNSFKIFCFFIISLPLVNIEAPSIRGLPDLVTLVDGDTKKYDPLYVVYQDNKYSFVEPTKYNLVMRKHKYETSQDKVKMLAACTKNDNTPNNEALLEIVPVDEETLDKRYQCDTPIKFFAKKESKSTRFTIGFMIYDKEKDSSDISLLPNTPKDQFPIPLIRISYKTAPRIQTIATWHDIKFTDMLPLDEDPDQQSLNNSIYEKNVDIYEYDIDPAYNEENQQKFTVEFFDEKTPTSTSRLVKLQLTPSADFYFDAWKWATRCNINTVPIWKELVEEWQQLERFIRQVAKVIGDLRIITGGTYPASKANEKNPTVAELIPFYEYQDEKSSNKKPLLMFERLFKAVTFNQQRQNGEWIRYGILFMMINDPHTVVHQNNKIARKTGWSYLHQNKWNTRFSTYTLDYKSMANLNIDNDGEVYEPFDLNEVIKLTRNDKEEIETKVDVLRKMGLKKMRRPVEDDIDLDQSIIS
ncbi:uncharacterized protein LOC135847727 [Planococcus citri]|uniref:uncharacterized protein LOC135847727 n=1 Tax=Planococcus citri TaxID=170843 RepID=UPI0031FA33BC